MKTGQLIRTALVFFAFFIFTPKARAGDGCDAFSILGSQLSVPPDDVFARYAPLFGGIDLTNLSGGFRLSDGPLFGEGQAREIRARLNEPGKTLSDEERKIVEGYVIQIVELLHRGMEIPRIIDLIEVEVRTEKYRNIDAIRGHTHRTASSFDSRFAVTIFKTEIGPNIVVNGIPEIKGTDTAVFTDNFHKAPDSMEDRLSIGAFFGFRPRVPKKEFNPFRYR